MRKTRFPFQEAKLSWIKNSYILRKLNQFSLKCWNWNNPKLDWSEIQGTFYTWKWKCKFVIVHNLTFICHCPPYVKRRWLSNASLWIWRQVSLTTDIVTWSLGKSFPFIPPRKKSVALTLKKRVLFWNLWKSVRNRRENIHYFRFQFSSTLVQWNINYSPSL